MESESESECMLHLADEVPKSFGRFLSEHPDMFENTMVENVICHVHVGPLDLFADEFSKSFGRYFKEHPDMFENTIVENYFF